MVLAVALEPDVLQDDHLVIAVGLFEGPLEQFDRIDAITGEEFLVRANDAVGGTQQAFTVGIVSRPQQQGADGFFGFGTAGAFYAGGAAAMVGRTANHIVRSQGIGCTHDGYLSMAG